MTRFAKQIEMALRLIKKNGQRVVWREVENNIVDSDKPWQQGEAQIKDNDVIICFLPIDLQTQQTLTFLKGTELPRGSVMGYMGKVPFEPNLKDVVIRDGKELRIVNIDLLSPNGEKVLYEIVFRE